jgi:hypothetical protein
MDKKHKPKGRLRNESMLKALPPDILQELVRRRLAEIEKFMPHYTVEPASPKECAKVKARVKESYADPSSFVPLESIK